MEISIEELRNIILGKIQYKKCPCCDNNGFEYWDEEGISVLPSPLPEWGENYGKGICENCNGLGFIQICLQQSSN